MVLKYYRDNSDDKLIPTHIDLGLTKGFWFSLGYDISTYPFQLKLENGEIVRVWRNRVRGGRKGRYRGYQVGTMKSSTVVHNRLVASALTLAALVAGGMEYTKPPPPPPAPPPPPPDPGYGKWYVWDDNIPAGTMTKTLLEKRKRDHPEYDFIAVISQFHDNGSYQIEGRKRDN